MVSIVYKRDLQIRVLSHLRQSYGSVQSSENTEGVLDSSILDRLQARPKHHSCPHRLESSHLHAKN